MIKKLCLNLICVALALPLVARKTSSDLAMRAGCSSKYRTATRAFRKLVWTNPFASRSSRVSKRLAPA